MRADRSHAGGRRIGTGRRAPLEHRWLASNTAIDLAKLDVKVGIAGCVGQDVFGRFVIETLEGAGVETSGVRQIAGVGTSATLILNVRGEDRRYIHTLGANAVMSCADISLEQVKQAKVFYVGGYLLMPRLEQKGELATLFAAARAAGVKTVLDVVLPGPGDHWFKIADVLAETDVFLPNEDEAAALTGLDDPVRQAEQFLAAGAGTVVITCGAKGTLLATREHRLFAKTYPTQFVGGTGAGDAFDAGYIAGMLAGEDSAAACAWGSAMGAGCVRAVSTTESVFHRAEALAFIRADAGDRESLRREATGEESVDPCRPANRGR